MFAKSTDLLSLLSLNLQKHYCIELLGREA